MFKLIYFIFILNIFCCVKNVYSLNCTSCSSVTDPYCATFNFPAGIIGLPSIQCDETVTQCYEEFNSVGHTFRGCGPPPTPTCIAGTNCFTCDTENCNGNIIPTNRHQCQQCVGSQCSAATGPSYCLHIFGDERCYSYVNGNQARKGCASDEIYADVQVGCDAGVPNCQTCTGNNCNSVNIAENLCYNCNTTANAFCLTSPGQPTSCFGFTQSPCYLSIEDGEMGERVHGCLSTLSAAEAQQCPLAGQTTCKSCVGDFCNARFEFLECLNCNGNTNCASTLDIPNQRCSRLNDECMVHFNQGNTIRGCLLEQTQPIQNDCNNLQICNTCEGVGCNNLVIEDLNCITCNSNTHPNCGTITDQALSVSCGQLSVHRSCYLRRTESFVERGCITSLVEPALTECFDNSDTCKRCIGDNCNAREFTTCYACDSATNVNCAILEEDLSGNVITCRNMTDTCRVFVDSTTGLTHRGCSEQSPDVACGPTMTLCSECEGENCNENLFPENRARCHQCIGPQCTTIDTAIQRTCSVFSLTPQCFAFIDENLITHRGCLHDDTNLMQTCQSMNAACFQCSPTVTHNCNTIQTINDPILSCIQCNNTEACGWGHEFESAVPCTADVIFPHIEQCFTYEDEDGDIVRGCQLDDTRCDLHDSCERCTDTHGCNNANRITSTCIQCRSSLNDNQDCVNADTTGFERECETPFYTYENRGCYTLREQDGTVVRGCASDLDAELRAECNEENSPCNLCLENVCNNNEPPSAGNALVKMSFITLIFICVFSKIINQ